MANSKDWIESTRAIVEKVKERAGPVGRAIGSKLAPVARRVGAAIASTALFQKLAAKARAQSMDPGQAAEQLTKFFQSAGLSFYGILLTIFLCTWFLADLTSLVVEDYIPEPPRSVAVAPRGLGPRQGTLEDYNAIFARNLFNSQGLIPGEETQGGAPSDLGGEPVRTNLPLNLIGTIILADELRSLATIEDKSASQVYPVRVDDEIPSKARIVSIQSRKVIFVNVSSGRREFLELPQDPLVSNPRVTIAPRGGGGGGKGVERVAPNNFSVSRNEIDKQLGDLNNVLTQARCVPNFENGMPSGFKCFQIVPGSIYDKLGLQNGDVLTGVDGEAINDPAKAFELLNKLKTTNHVELTIKRDGRQQNYAYDIN